MTTKETKSPIRRYIEEAWNKGNAASIEELMATSYARYMEGSAPPLDREGQKQRIKGFLNAFPDFRLTIEDLVAEGDKVVFRMTGRGTHHGAFMGITPTGKPMTITIIDIARFANGQVVEHWGNRDALGMLQQLGAILMPG